MSAELRLGFIGVGAMGESILAGLLKSKNYSVDMISVAGRTSGRADRVSAAYKVHQHNSAEELVNNSDVVCLCIKPKDLSALSEQLKNVDTSGKLFISTLAGVSERTLQERFPDAFIIRSIPNIASEICKGVTLWKAAKNTPEYLIDYTRIFCESIGQSIVVEEESYIEHASPISGAAPAFMGIFVEAMCDAGVFTGLPRELSVQLALQSLMGSCELIHEAKGNAQLVRHRVTSPGGLTAVCVSELEAAGLRTAIMNAVVAGKKKTEQLGKAVSEGQNKFIKDKTVVRFAPPLPLCSCM